MSSVHTPEYRILLKRLREARIEAGLTQGQAAAKFKKHQSFVSKLESGERRIDFVELQAFARLYGKPVSYFEALEPRGPKYRA